MFRIHNRRETEGQVDVDRTAYRLIRSETTVSIGGRGFGVVVSYGRPAVIESELGGPARPLHDHVMMARLTAVAIVVLSFIWRWRNG